MITSYVELLQVWPLTSNAAHMTTIPAGIVLSLEHFLPFFFLSSSSSSGFDS